MCFRYVLKPMESMVANVFMPSAGTGEGENAETPQTPWRHQTLGAVFIGNMDKIIANKRASVVWEARHFF